MLNTILQILAAFFAALGGLLISSDFIGTEKLNSIDSKFKTNLDDFEFTRWDSLTSIAGYGMYWWSKIGFFITVIIAVVLTVIHNLIYPLPLFYILGIYFVLVVANITLGHKTPDWMGGVIFFLMLPMLSIPFIIEWLFIVPVLIIKKYAKLYKIPSLIKLSGALCVVLSFMIFLLSYTVK